MPKIKGAIYRYIVYDGNAWSDIKTSDTLDDVNWIPQNNGNYMLCFQIVLSGGRILNQFLSFKISDMCDIMGNTNVSVNQMVQLYKSSGYIYPTEIMAKGGAATIDEFCKMYLEEAKAENVRADVAFCQAMLETRWLQYGGDVTPDQYNFAGLGATGNGEQGNRFTDVRTGIRAQIQHLKCYASTEKLNQICVDPRWGEWLRGKAPYVEWLSIPNNPYKTGWASDSQYSESILKMMDKLHQFTL